MAWGDLGGESMTTLWADKRSGSLLGIGQWAEASEGLGGGGRAAAHCLGGLLRSALTFPDLRSHLLGQRPSPCLFLQDIHSYLPQPCASLGKTQVKGNLRSREGPSLPASLCLSTPDPSARALCPLPHPRNAIIFQELCQALRIQCWPKQMKFTI